LFCAQIKDRNKNDKTTIFFIMNFSPKKKPPLIQQGLFD